MQLPVYYYTNIDALLHNMEHKLSYLILLRLYYDIYGEHMFTTMYLFSKVEVYNIMAIKYNRLQREKNKQ